ncbi:transglycosylase domain-containing protein [Arthrobacter cavernae]|nr:transglycosylase domain-containing protein [Arthrobacter cavernae]
MAAIEASTTVTTPIRKRKKKHIILRSIGWFFKLVIALVILSLLATISFIWWTPPRTSYMMQSGEPVVYQYVSIDHISRYVLAATIAHEDQELGTRPGAFDIEAFNARAKAYIEGKPDPSGSTIPQQLAKNIFLTPQQNAVRKGIEAGLATEFSLILSEERILELYLNYAQFGPKLYGICAATWYYFGNPPWNITEYQAAQLMGVLPLPNLVQRAKDGGIYLGPVVNFRVWDYVNGAANVHVPRQIEGMGGWKAAVATIGITDTAADHANERGSADSCSAMPSSVLDRIKQEDSTWKP